jgi:hypothetical protein
MLAPTLSQTSYALPAIDCYDLKGEAELLYPVISSENLIPPALNSNIPADSIAESSAQCAAQGLVLRVRGTVGATMVHKVLKGVHRHYFYILGSKNSWVALQNSPIHKTASCQRLTKL